MQNLWFIGPIWYKGKVIKSPKKVEPYFRYIQPSRIPEKVSKNIISTATYLKIKTRYS